MGFGFIEPQDAVTTAIPRERRVRIVDEVRVFGCLWCLTFELSRARREDARPALRMMNLTVARAWWLAVGARLE